MTPLPPVANTMRVDMQWNIGNDTTALVRFYLGYSGGAPDATDCAAFCADVHSAFDSHLAALLYTGSQVDQIKVTDIASDTGAQAFINIADNGTRSGGALPAGTAAVSSYRIARRYRGGKPRSYWPFGVDSDLADRGDWTSGFVSATTTGVTAFFAALAGASSGSTTISGQINVSYFQGYLPPTVAPNNRAKNNVKPRVGGPITDAILGWTTNPRPASQRRRNLNS